MTRAGELTGCDSGVYPDIVSRQCAHTVDPCRQTVAQDGDEWVDDAPDPD